MRPFSCSEWLRFTSGLPARVCSSHESTPTARFASRRFEPGSGAESESARRRRSHESGTAALAVDSDAESAQARRRPGHA